MSSCPIKLTLEFLHQVTSNDAIIIVDDYGHFSSGAKTAVDEFVEEKNSSAKVYECLIPNTQYGHFAVLAMKG